LAISIGGKPADVVQITKARVLKALERRGVVRVSPQPLFRLGSAQRMAENLGLAERMVWPTALEEESLAPIRAHALASVAPLRESARNLAGECLQMDRTRHIWTLATAHSESVSLRSKRCIKDTTRVWFRHAASAVEAARQ
jgi:hypothetical protein